MRKLKQALFFPFRFIYKFILFKIVLPLTYKNAARKKVVESRVVFIEVRLPALSNNFTLLWNELRSMGKELSLSCLHLGTAGPFAYIRNCLYMAKNIACARHVFISEGSTAFSCLPIRKETTVIQTWHGCGALKRVGLSALGNGENVTGGKTERKIFPMCRHMDFITISSPAVAWAYEEAFDIKPGDNQKICPVGTSRTDIFFMPDRIELAKNKLLKKLPLLNGRKILLYAPTFRGETTAARLPDGLDIREMRKALGGEYILLIKHHPVIKAKQVIPVECKDFAFDMSEIPIDDLLMAADICISDYSSLVFDYSLLKRPMIFFVYDIEEYMDWRGLYYPFEDFCPGPIVKSTKELVSAIRSDELYDEEKMRLFHERQMASCDGHATERIIELMDEEPLKIKGDKL